MPCPVGPITSAAVAVPLIVAGEAGHACVPAGPLPRFVHRKIEIPPVIAGAPKWMCDWSTLPSSASYDSVHENDSPSLSTFALKVPPPVVEIVSGVSL